MSLSGAARYSTSKEAVVRSIASRDCRWSAALIPACVRHAAHTGALSTFGGDFSHLCRFRQHEMGLRWRAYFILGVTAVKAKARNVA